MVIIIFVLIRGTRICNFKMCMAVYELQNLSKFSRKVKKNDTKTKKAIQKNEILLGTIGLEK